MNSINEVLLHLLEDKGIITVGELLVLVWAKKREIKSHQKTKNKKENKRKTKMITDQGPSS